MDFRPNLKMVMEQAIASARVLVVEDDEAIADVLRRSLRAEGHEVRSAGDGAEALTAAEQFSPDLVVLDLGLPRLDGMEVCRRLRAESDVPILILTARTETEDRVKGLDTGADDYLSKPFERSELLARIRALLRRRPPRGSASIIVGDLLVNPDTREVKRGEREIELTNREFELLEYLARNQKLVVSRERLLEDVWGYDPFEQTNTIDVFISNLRRKLESGRRAAAPPHQARGGLCAEGRRVSWIRSRKLPLFERIPVRWRIAITTAGLTLLILVCFALVLGNVVGNRIRSDFREELRGAARSLAAETKYLDPPSAQRSPRAPI